MHGHGRMDSHTSTPEWQVFETKMRQRHLERCLVQAAAALDANALEEARAAVDEATGLSPGHPEIIVLTARLAARLQDSTQLSNRLIPPAAATAALLGFALACGTLWAIPESGPMIARLLDMATTVVAHMVNIATSAGVPQSV